MSGGAPVSPAPPPSPLEVDSLGLWDAVVALPEDLAALAAAPGLDVAGTGRPDGVVVHAVDEAGLAARLVAAVAAREASAPVVVASSFGLPAYAGRGWVVVAVSWSGDDEETLAAADAARAAGAAVVVVTGGGALGREAGDRGWPVVPVPAFPGASGAPPGPGPRARLGALTAPPLLVLERLGLVAGVAGRLHATAAYLAGRRDVLAAPGGPAAEVARRIGRTVPLVHGDDGPAGVAARRWKSAFNLNAKSPAFCANQPELDHDEVAGWGLGGDVTRQVLTLVTLRHDGEDPRLARRADLVAEMMTEIAAAVVAVRSGAADDLARFYELALVGDLVSLLRAGAEGVDPGPVPALAEVAGTAPGSGGPGR